MRTFTASPLFAIPSLDAKPLIVDLDFALVSLPIKNRYLKRARWELLWQSLASTGNISPVYIIAFRSHDSRLQCRIERSRYTISTLVVLRLSSHTSNAVCEENSTIFLGYNQQCNARIVHSLWLFREQCSWFPFCAFSRCSETLTRADYTLANSEKLLAVVVCLQD